jgi:hypothetical protein
VDDHPVVRQGLQSLCCLFFVRHYRDLLVIAHISRMARNGAG